LAVAARPKLLRLLAFRRFAEIKKQLNISGITAAETAK